MNILDIDPDYFERLREYELRLGGYRDGKEEGIAIGRKEGIKERKKEIAMNLVNQNIGYDIISKATGLSVSEIEKIVEDSKRLRIKS